MWENFSGFIFKLLPKLTNCIPNWNRRRGPARPGLSACGNGVLPNRKLNFRNITILERERRV